MKAVLKTKCSVDSNRSPVLCLTIQHIWLRIDFKSDSKMNTIFDLEHTNLVLALISIKLCLICFYNKALMNTLFEDEEC